MSVLTAIAVVVGVLATICASAFGALAEGKSARQGTLILTMIAFWVVVFICIIYLAAS